MRKSEGLCWGRKAPPERPMCWNGRSESNSWMREPWGDPRRIAGRAVVTSWPVSSASVSVATRKMVNYA